MKEQGGAKWSSLVFLEQVAGLKLSVRRAPNWSVKLNHNAGLTQLTAKYLLKLFKVGYSQQAPDMCLDMKELINFLMANEHSQNLH